MNVWSKIAIAFMFTMLTVAAFAHDKCEGQRERQICVTTKSGYVHCYCVRGRG